VYSASTSEWRNAAFIMAGDGEWVTSLPTMQYRSVVFRRPSS
jgi:hypothetical protein